MYNRAARFPERSEAVARASLELRGGDWAAAYAGPELWPTLYAVYSRARRSPSGVPGLERSTYAVRRVSVLPDGSLRFSDFRMSLDSRKIVQVGDAARALVGLPPARKRKPRTGPRR